MPDALTTSITPTVGRVVLCYSPLNGPEPLPGLVTRLYPGVKPVTVVDVYVLPDGRCQDWGVVQRVPLFDSVADAGAFADDCYCTWMPYQINQAAKHAAG